MNQFTDRDVFDVEPNLGASTPEPCLRSIILRYYTSNGIDEQSAKLWTEQYISQIKTLNKEGN